MEMFIREFCNGWVMKSNHKYPGSEFSDFSRNAALWEAYDCGFEYILSVEDVTHPQDLFSKTMIERMDKSATFTASSSTGYLNLGEICIPRVNQCGNPFGLSTVINRTISHGQDDAPKIVIGIGMPVNKPYADAISELLDPATIVGLTQAIIVEPGTYAAFGMQSTMVRREWAPVLVKLPHIGKYGEIFPSFIFARLAKSYNVCLYAGDPVVSHHPDILASQYYVEQLRDEFYGMRFVYEFVHTLDAAYIDKSMPLWVAYSELVSAVSKFLPDNTVKFANAWVNGWRERFYAPPD